MARSKTARRSRSGESTTAVPRSAVSTNKKPHARGSIRSRFGWAPALVPLPALVLGAVLVFVFHQGVHDWMLGALGYGLAPVALWMVAFGLTLRHRRNWVPRFWRLWVASALAVAITLAILSMVHASEGVLGDASLGGYWGGYLGGTPIVLGAVKVAVLALLVPLALFPKRGAILYWSVAKRTARETASDGRWLVSGIARQARDLKARRASKQVGFGAPGTATDPTPLAVDVGIETASEVVVAAPIGGARQPAFEAQPEPAEEPEPPKSPVKAFGWQLPSLDLLNKAEPHQVSQSVLKEMSHHIESTLADHRVDVAVEDVRTGPRVIRFGLVPGWVKKYRESVGGKSKSGDPPTEMSRVKVQSILVREKDLALALKTPYLRLEAPVPGEALVGLEVPNPNPRTVVLHSVAESQVFKKIEAKGGLPVAIGEDTGGEAVVSDLTGLPHLLIAGATGSGKSVCMNSVVASLLLTSEPDRVRMLMVDPKRVELTPFNGIPHLIAPVIVDTDEVLAVLRSVQGEMLRRYKLMEELGVRNIDGYNRKADERMPYLVLIIDELADLMMAAAYEVEQGLVRLAQLGRATGIHLILATQRPSVNVVTGLLKANIPARIAFAVASQVDSRVILDSVGAERLLGKGDMLVLTSDSPRPQRVQGTFVHDREIEKLVEFWQGQSGPPLPQISLDESDGPDEDEEIEDDDELMDKARDLAGTYQRLSPSVIQRRLQVGYPKAMQLMRTLVEEGLTHPSA